MKFVFVTDLHGITGLYRQLASFCRSEKPDVLLLGGDLFPDGKRPQPHLEQIRFIESYFRTWVADLTAVLPAVRIMTVLGNHDWLAAAASLGGAGGSAGPELLSNTQCRRIGDAEVFGYSNVPMTPFWAKDMERLDRPGDGDNGYAGRCFVTRGAEVAEVPPEEHFRVHPTITDELAALPEASMRNAIWVSHCPPAGTFADMMYGPRHVGSHGVRAFVDGRRPRVSLHGHIHEAPAVSGTFADMVGDTLVVNPGRTYDHLDAVVFDWADPAATLRHTRFGLWL